MARIRKEKGHTVQNPPLIAKDPSTKSKSREKSKLSKQITRNDIDIDISSLGGTADDVALLKGVQDHNKTVVDISTGAENKDPSLQADVTQFLKGLNLASNGDHRIKDTKGKGKEKAKPQNQKDKDKDSAKSKSDRISTQITTPTSTEKPSGKKDKRDKREKVKDKKEGDKSSPTKPKPKTVPQPEPSEKVQLPTKISLNPKSQFIFQPTSQWYAALPALSGSTTTSITPAQLSSLSAKAAELHEQDIKTFQTSSSSSASNNSLSEANFLSKIIQSGTLSDRLSALTLLVQSSPVHNTKALDTLKQMAERGKGKGGREESLKALRCIVDWWTGGGAPARKLKYFRDQPLLHPGVTDEYLLFWHFEDWLKKFFFSVLQILESLSLDPLTYVRTQTLNLLFLLLRDTPEQEHNLLRLLVNKLGDTEKAVASRTSHHLLQLLQTHPAMKGIVVRDIVALILRPTHVSPTPITTSSSLADGAPAEKQNKHIRFDDAEANLKKKPTLKPAGSAKTSGNPHARYYATVTFNQIVLTPGDREVALQLIDVYFELFKELLGEGVEGAEEDEEDENKDKEGEKEIKTDKGGRVLDRGKKGKGRGKVKQGEVKGAAGFVEVEDSNSKLISAILTGVNRSLPFARVEATDTGINKHIDTLFLITHKSTFNISLQALVLIQQITVSFSKPSSSSSSSSSSSTTAKSITDRYFRTLYASLHDVRLADSSKQAMYLNLFFKSVKADVGTSNADNESNERVKALIRRFIQVLVSGGGAPEFIAGGLYLLGELFSTIPGLRTMITQNPTSTTSTSSPTYDPRKRDPQFAHASASPLWELTPLLKHYHPAVALHARQLLLMQPLTASPDLAQNTLMHFLDRFVYRNAKKVKGDAGEEGEGGKGGKGGSAMQPAASALEGVKLVKGDIGVNRREEVNEQIFLRKRRGEVPVDQMFFYEYFTRKNDREKARAARIKKRKEGGDSEDSEDEEEGDEGEEDEDEDEGKKGISGDEDEDEDESGSELDEDEVWKAMQATIPKVAGEDDDLLDGSDMDEDEDEIPSGLDDDSDDESEEVEGNETGKIIEDNDEEEGDLSLVEASDNEDLISLDGDLPDGLIEYDGSDASASEQEEEAWGGISGDKRNGKSNKRKRGEKGEGAKEGSRRKKLRSLPTFASYEDYAKLIEEGPEDDI